MKTTNWIKGAVGIAATFMIGCSDSGVSTFPPGQFASGLRVVFSDPDYLAEYVDVNHPILVKLTEPVDPTSISGITVKYTSGTTFVDMTTSGRIDLAESNSSIIFTPTTSYPKNSGVTMNLPASIRAASGKQMIPTNVTFFTGPRIEGVGGMSVPGAPRVSSVETSSYYYGCMEFVVRFNEDLSTSPQAQVKLVELFGIGKQRTIPLYAELLYGNSLQNWLMSVPQGFCPCDMFATDVDVTLQVFGSSVLDLQGEHMAGDYKHTYGWGDDFYPQYCYY